jgi:hypothetical protein
MEPRDRKGLPVIDGLRPEGCRRMAETAVHLGTTGTVGDDHRIRAGMAYDQEGRWLGAQIARPFPSSAGRARAITSMPLSASLPAVSCRQKSSAPTTLGAAAPQTYLPRNSAGRRGMVTGDHDNTDARSATMSDGLRHPLAWPVFAGEQPREDEPSIRLLLNPGTGLQAPPRASDDLIGRSRRASRPDLPMRRAGQASKTTSTAVSREREDRRSQFHDIGCFTGVVNAR